MLCKSYFQKNQRGLRGRESLVFLFNYHVTIG